MHFFLTFYIFLYISFIYCASNTATVYLGYILAVTGAGIRGMGNGLSQPQSAIAHTFCIDNSPKIGLTFFRSIEFGHCTWQRTVFSNVIRRIQRVRFTVDSISQNIHGVIFSLALFNQVFCVIHVRRDRFFVAFCYANICSLCYAMGNAHSKSI